MALYDLGLQLPAWLMKSTGPKRAIVPHPWLQASKEAVCVLKAKLSWPGSVFTQGLSPFPAPSAKDTATETTDVPPGELHCCVAVDIGKQAEAEALRIWGVRETIHGHWGLRSVECLSHSLVELIIGNGAPEGWFTIGDWLEICKKKVERIKVCFFSHVQFCQPLKNAYR